MIKQDYKQAKSNSKKRFAALLTRIPFRFHPAEAGLVAVGILLLAFAFSPSDEAQALPEPAAEGEINLAQAATPALSSVDRDDNQRFELALQWDTASDIRVSSQAENPAPEETLVKQFSVKVKSGDSLSSIFSSQGFTAQDVYRITQDKTAAEKLQKIRPGQTLNFEVDQNGELQALYYTLAVNETLKVKRTSDGFVSDLKQRPIEIRQAFASGTIEDSLFAAGKEAGLSDTLIVKLANIFGWDIDFVLDVRKNDRFTMIYETRYLDGEYIGDGEIIAAEFINQGDTYRAVRYVDSKGDANFYTPEGKSMRKAFLRAPVNFMYISSNFNPGRLHPVLKVRRPHRGIDYAAPVGTPIYAAGDGKVIASSYNKYNGKYVFIQHGNSIVTKYLHMTRRAVSYGKRVKQGQIIGYVGATGLASGPHLHYEFVVNGVHRNPRTVKLPEAAPVAASERSRFDQDTAPLLASLDAYQRLNSVAAAR